MKTINLTQGKVALVDDEDYEYLNQWKWYAHKKSNTYYAARTIYIPKRQQIYMHRVILNAPKGAQVDHININGLDNQKLNLRLCNNTENQRHQQLRLDNTTGFKGVSIKKGCVSKPYYVQIHLNNKPVSLGYYLTAKEAAQAYDEAALKYYNKFALTNKMLGLL